MSSGLYLVVDAINAIGAAASNAAVEITAAAAAEANATAGKEGGSGGGGMGSAASQGGPNATGGREGGPVPKWGTVTVTPLGSGQVIAELQSLQGRGGSLPRGG